MAGLALGLAAGPAPAAPQVDGLLDLDFAGDGVVLDTGLFDELEIRALAADGDLLIAAGRRKSDPPGPPATPQFHAHWWSLTSSGAPSDQACEGASTSTFPFSFADSSHLEAALIDSAGRLVVGGALATVGTESQDRALIARFDLGQSGCVIDTSFSTSGWEIFDDDPPCDTDDCVVVDLVEQTAATGAVAGRRYVALLRAITGGFGASRFFLVGLTESGDPDPTFADDGWQEVTHASLGAPLYGETKLAMDPRGRLYVAVTYSDPTDALDLDVGVLRYAAHGALDTSFWGSGFATISEHGSDPIDMRAFDVAAQADGLAFVTFGAGEDNWLWAGRSTTASSDYLGALKSGLLGVQGNSRVIIVGDSDAIEPDTSRAVRLDTDQSSPSYLAPDPTWGVDSVATYDIDFDIDTPHEVTAALLWNGRLVVGGSLGTASTFVLRAENSFVFADGFEAGTMAGW
jgi:hypothetical protein